MEVVDGSWNDFDLDHRLLLVLDSLEVLDPRLAVLQEIGIFRLALETTSHTPSWTRICQLLTGLSSALLSGVRSCLTFTTK